MEAEAIVKRFDSQWSKDANWRSLWQEAADYVLPRVSNIIAYQTPGQKLTSKLYDAAGIKAHSDLSSSLASSMSNMAIRWFNFKLRQRDLNELYEVKQWLEICEDVVYTALAQSNFSAEINEFWELLVAFGSASIFVEERHGNHGPFNGLLFRTRPVASYVVFENSEGFVDTVYTKFSKSLRALDQEFGIANLSERSQEEFKKNPDCPIEIVHAIYPGETKYKGHKYVGCYVEYKQKHKIREDGYFEFPSPTVRWKKDGEEVWGRGPTQLALPDIKTLNTAVRLRLKQWAKIVDPPMIQLDDSVIGQTQLKAGSLITARTKDALTPLVTNARIDFAIQQEERLENKIKNTFYADRISLPNKQYMTAYEVAALREQMQSLLGPTAGRIEGEGLTPLITRVFGLLYRAGEIPPPPDAIMKASDPTIDIKYEGPLAKAQRSSQLAAVQNTLQVLAPLVQLDPEVADVFDLDETARGVGEYNGLPTRFIRDKAKVQERRTQRQQAQQAAVQENSDMNQSEMARNAAPMVKAMQDQGDGSMAPAGGNS